MPFLNTRRNNSTSTKEPQKPFFGKTNPSLDPAQSFFQPRATNKQSGNQSLMRQATDGTSTASPQLSSQLNSSKGGGQSLPKDTLSSMNQAFGADFSNVRVHTDSRAQDMSDGIQAKAFTHSSDIYFNKGQYNPSSSNGKRLLAHELTHVVQQGQGIKRDVIQKEGKEEKKDKAELVVKQDLKKGVAKTEAKAEADVPNVKDLSQVSSVKSEPEESKYLQSLKYKLGAGFSLGAGLGAKEESPFGSPSLQYTPFINVNLGHESQPFKWLSTEAKVSLLIDPKIPVAASFDGSLVFMPDSYLSFYLSGAMDSYDGTASLQAGAKLKAADWLYFKGGPSIGIDSTGNQYIGGSVGLGIVLPIDNLFVRTRR